MRCANSDDSWGVDYRAATSSLARCLMTMTRMNKEETSDAGETGGAGGAGGTGEIRGTGGTGETGGIGDLRETLKRVPHTFPQTTRLLHPHTHCTTCTIHSTEYIYFGTLIFSLGGHTGLLRWLWSKR